LILFSVHHLNALKIHNLKLYTEEKILTQFIIAHYRGNTCGIEKETTLIALRNIINTKTPIAVAQKAQQFLQILAHLMMAK
jgi:hypothetical protein